MEYKVLDTDWNEIRLMTLLPEDIEGCIRVHVDHVSLIDASDYVALSYCWGDQASWKEIIIGDVAVQVTLNLESALRHLQAKGYSRLWVDAVCIKQQDPVERSQQLLWMGSIYRRATESQRGSEKRPMIQTRLLILSRTAVLIMFLWIHQGLSQLSLTSTR
jgi:hypothetical protein